ncbi:MAG: nucleoside-diphosphate kinase [Candidatus Gastranaerophilales bacterium]|nr:nucleoside-diphosphate kinase [Candidatus Gastranaerophilales bacterium]
MAERTFVAIKPDGVKRNLIGRIITKFEEKGYKLIGLKLLLPTLEMAEKHYAEHKGKPFYPRLIEYITSGPIVAMVIQGDNVIAESRRMMGSTKPEEAEAGTIRFEYAINKEYNIIHGSDSPESAEREIAIYFKEEELCSNWTTMLEMIMGNDK